MNRVKAKVAIPIGLDNVYVAKVTADVAGGKTTYEAPEYAARAIKCTMTPVTKTGTLESDDAVEIDQTVITGYTVSIEESQLDDYMRALIFGHRLISQADLLSARPIHRPSLRFFVAQSSRTKRIINIWFFTRALSRKMRKSMKPTRETLLPTRRKRLKVHSTQESLTALSSMT